MSDASNNGTAVIIRSKTLLCLIKEVLKCEMFSNELCMYEIYLILFTSLTFNAKKINFHFLVGSFHLFRLKILNFK